MYLMGEDDWLRLPAFLLGAGLAGLLRGRRGEAQGVGGGNDLDSSSSSLHFILTARWSSVIRLSHWELEPTSKLLTGVGGDIVETGVIFVTDDTGCDSTEEVDEDDEETAIIGIWFCGLFGTFVGDFSFLDGIWLGELLRL